MSSWLMVYDDSSLPRLIVCDTRVTLKASKSAALSPAGSIDFSVIDFQWEAKQFPQFLRTSRAVRRLFRSLVFLFSFLFFRVHVLSVLGAGLQRQLEQNCASCGENNHE